MKRHFSLKPLALAVCGCVITPSALAFEVVDELIDSSSHTLNVYVNHFTNTPSDISYDNRSNQLLVAMESSAQAYIGDAGVLDLKWLTLATTMKSSNQGLLGGFDRDSERAALITPSVLRYVLEEDDYDLSLGLDTISFGYGDLHNSVNVFGSLNAVHPGHSYDLGVLQAALTYYVEDDTLIYAWMPVDQLSPQAVGSNRWQGSGGSGYDKLPNGDDVEDLENVPLDVTFSNSGHLLRYDATRSGYDYYVFGYRGPSPYSIIVTNAGDLSQPYKKSQPLATQIGGGVSVVVGAHKMYVDSVFQDTESGLDEDFVRATLGTQLKESDYVKSLGISEVSLTLEYAFDTVVREQSDDIDLIFSSEKTRSGRDSIYSRFEVEQNYNWAYALAYSYNFESEDSVTTLGAQFKSSDSLKYFAGYTYSKGDEGTPYGSSVDNNMLELGMEVSF